MIGYVSGCVQIRGFVSGTQHYGGFVTGSYISKRDQITMVDKM